MAVNFTPVGQEVQVNTPLDRGEYDPDAAALTDGRFAVVYTRDFASNDWDVRLQFINADGTRSGDQIAIDNDPGLQHNAAIAPRLGGGAVVAWMDINGKDANSNPLTNAVQLRVVSSTGVTAAPLTVSSGNASDPDVALLADGRVLVVWQEDYTTDSDVGLRVLNAAGTSLATEQWVEQDAGFSSAAPAIAASGNKALVAFEDRDDDDIRVELFDGASGAFALPGSPGQLVASAGTLRSPDVAALVDGRYVVVWENDSSNHVEGRFVDANGNPIGAVFTISNNPRQNVGPQVAALPDGGFMVTWETNGGGIAPEKGLDWAVLGRRFDSTGAAAGDLFLVNTGDPNTNQYHATVAVNLSSGRAFIAWDDEHAFTGTGQDNDPPGVRGRGFQVTTEVVNGTPGDDTLTTYSLSETINGLEGNDTIDAKGGNDAVDGGPGSDLLRGGGGDDTVAGADGADTMNGDDGNDLVDGGLGNDSLTGGPGADSFAFKTAIKPKGSNVDTIADFVAADDTILLDNAIFTKLKSEGVLAAKYFEVGKKAKSGKDAIVYNDKTGDLLYDKNGDKKGGALLFGHLEGSPDDVSASDFLVV